MSRARHLLLFGLWLLGSLLAGPVLARTVYYVHTDALHSVAVITDAQGHVVERTYYAPYGAVLNRTLRNGPGYGGHEEDAATGLVYMQQRYYCAECGRFLSADPVQADPNTGANFNRYWYAKDNPYRYTDPDGRQSSCTGSHIGGGACGSLNLKVYRLGEPSAPTAKIAHQMVSNNPADRVSAAHSAMHYFGIKPAAGTVTINYKADFKDYGEIIHDVHEPAHGIVILGPSAYKTWAHLGSTLGHEIEVHWNRQMLQCLCNAVGSHEHDRWEMQAYKYNIESAQRFGNSAEDVKEFKGLYDAYKYDLEHTPDEIYTK